MATVQTTKTNQNLLPNQPAASEQRADQYINEQLAKAATFVKVVDLFGSLMQLMWLSLGGMLVLSIVDAWIFELPMAIRTIAFLGLLAIVVYWIVKHIVPLAIYRISPAYAARSIEKRRPELKNSLINYLSMRGDTKFNSTSVFQLIGLRAANDLSVVPTDDAADSRKLVKVGIVLAVVLITCILYKLFSPIDPFQTVARVAQPLANLSRPSRINIDDVKPGNQSIYFGQSVEVSATITGSLAADQEVMLVYKTRDGQQSTHSIAMKSENSKDYIATLKTDSVGIQQSLLYYIVAGDGKSAEYSIDVQSVPTISIEKIQYDYPEYTGDAPMQRTGEQRIEAVEGTTINLTGRSNYDLSSAYIEFVKLQESKDKNSESEFKPVRTIELQATGNQVSGQFRMRLANDRKTTAYTHYRFKFSPDGDKKVHRSVEYPINVIADLPPTVKITDPSSVESAVPLNRTMLIEVEATDPDYEIHEVNLILTGPVANRDQRNLLELTELAGKSRVSGRYEFNPMLLRLKVGDEVTFFARARDNRQSAASIAIDSNVARTDEYTIKITKPEVERKRPDGNRDSRNDSPDDPQNKNQSDQDQNNEADQKQEANNQKNSGSKNGGENQQGNSGNNDKEGNQGTDSSNNTENQDEKNKGENNNTGENEKQDGNKQENNSQSGNQNSNNKQGDQQNGNEQKENEQQGDSSDEKKDKQKDQQQGDEQNNGNGSQEKQDTNDGSNAAQDEQSDAGNNIGQAQDSQSQSGGNSDDQNSQSSGGDNSQTDSGSGGTSGQNQQEKSPGQGNGDRTNSNQNSSDGNNNNLSNNDGTNGADGPGNRDDQLTDGQNQSQPLDRDAHPGERMERLKELYESSKEKFEGLKDETRGKSENGQDNNSSQPENNEGRGSDQERIEKNQANGAEETDKEKQGNGNLNDSDSGQSDSKDVSSNDKSAENKNASDSKGGQQDAAGNKDQKAQESEKVTGEKGEDQEGKQIDRSSTDNDSNNQVADNSKGPNGDEKVTDNGDQVKKDSVSKDGTNEKPGQSSSKNIDDQNQRKEKKPGQDANDDSLSENKTDNQRKDGPKNDGNNQKIDQDGVEGDSIPQQTDDSSASNDSYTNSNEEDKNQNESNRKSTDKSADGKNNSEQNSKDRNDNRKNSNEKTGRGKASKNNEFNSKQSAGSIDSEQERANLEYAKKATDLALKYLEEQKDNPDERLLQEMNWTPEEMREFLKRWKSMKEKAATGNVSEQREFNEALKSLGLRPPQNKLSGADIKNDDQRGMLEDGAISKPPADIAKKFRAFQRGRSRANN